MKIIKITNTAGRDIFINPEHVIYVCLDIMDSSRTQIHLTRDVHLVHLPVKDTLQLLGAKL